MSTHNSALLAAGARAALTSASFGYLMVGENIKRMIEHGDRAAAEAEVGHHLLVPLLLRHVAAVHTAIRKGRNVGDALHAAASSPDGVRLMEMAVAADLAKGGRNAPR